MVESEDTEKREEIEKGRQRMLRDDSDLEKTRLEKAFLFAIISIGFLAVMVVILSLTPRTAEEIVSISGVLTGLVGALAGLFGGVQAGSETKKTWMKQATLYRARFDLLFTHAPEDVKEEFLRSYGKLYESPKDQ